MDPREVLFISGDVGGNVPPTLAIAGELAHRGHSVAIAGLKSRAGDSWPDEVAAIPLPALDSLDVTRRTGPLGHVPSLTHLAMSAAVTRDVRTLLSRYPADAVIVDGIMLTSLREAQRRGIPSAALFHTLGQFWSDGMGNPVANVLLRAIGLSPKRLLAGADALLLPTDRELDPAGAGGSRFPFDWLGTTERALPAAERTPGAPALILVSLSSAWQRHQGDVYRRIIAAIAQLITTGMPIRAIVTTGGVEIDGPLDPVDGIEVLGRAPHAEIMPHADLVIGHGGHSTTLRALAHGVPILVLPLDPTSDQRMIGRAVETAGVGRVLPRTASPETLRAAIRKLLADLTIRDTASRIGKRLRAQNGAAAGADRIEAIAAPGRNLS